MRSCGGVKEVWGASRGCTKVFVKAQNKRTKTVGRTRNMHFKAAAAKAVV